MTLSVSRVERRGSGWRRSLGKLTLSVEMALSRVRGTGSTCISALPSLLSGMGLPAAATHESIAISSPHNSSSKLAVAPLHAWHMAAWMPGQCLYLRQGKDAGVPAYKHDM